MKKIILLFCLILILANPTTSFAWGLEIAGGAWYQSPSGDLSFDKTSKNDDIDIESNLNYKDEWQPNGRLIIDTPLFFPNIYLMYTPMNWDETGLKNVQFKFGDIIFDADVEFDSKLQMDHFDVGLFWGLPFIKTATNDILNIDLGLNVRVINFETELHQKDTGLKESIDYILPLPMLYTGVQIEPVKYLALELEGRGIAWSGNHYFSFTGRLKVRPFGPFFVAGGYRYDNVKIDYKDVDIDASFQGPFAEAGFEF